MLLVIVNLDIVEKVEYLVWVPNYEVVETAFLSY